MADAIEGPNLNLPPPQIERVSELKQPRESHEYEQYIIQATTRRSEEDKDKEQSKKKKDQQQDTFEREELSEEIETKPVPINRENKIKDTDEPGLVIDVTV